MKHTIKKEDGSSKVSDRMAWLAGKAVKVKVKLEVDGEWTHETFLAQYLDCYPMGRGYFFVFLVDESRRLVATDQVIEILELQGNKQEATDAKV